MAQCVRCARSGSDIYAAARTRRLKRVCRCCRRASRQCAAGQSPQVSCRNIPRSSERLQTRHVAYSSDTGSAAPRRHPPDVAEHFSPLQWQRQPAASLCRPPFSLPSTPLHAPRSAMLTLCGGSGRRSKRETGGAPRRPWERGRKGGSLSVAYRPPQHAPRPLGRVRY